MRFGALVLAIVVPTIFSCGQMDAVRGAASRGSTDLADSARAPAISRSEVALTPVFDLATDVITGTGVCTSSFCSAGCTVTDPETGCAETFPDPGGLSPSCTGTETIDSGPPVLVADACCTEVAGATAESNAANFNGTAIGAGDSIWFVSVIKASGVPSTGATIRTWGSTVSFTASGTVYDLPVPNGTIIFDPSASSASTTYGNDGWQTTTLTSLGGNTFVAGMILSVPSGLPGGVKPVTWQGVWTSSVSGVSVNWQWGAAVYSQFGTYTSINVKPVDGNTDNPYANSDSAGTPEAYKTYVVGGAGGGGGSNYTGGWSGTLGLTPMVCN